MQIVPFPAYYQSVYTNFDFTSFSLISWVVKGHLLRCKRAPFTHQKGMFCNAKGRLLHGKRACIDLRL